MIRYVALTVIFLSLGASFSQAQEDAVIKWTKGDSVMPKSEKIQLRCGWDTPYSITDIRWPATVQKVNGHWLLIGDDGTNRVDGKAISGWASNSDVLRFKSAKPDRLIDQTAEKVVSQYSNKLNKSKSPWLHWLRGICLEQLGLFDAALLDYEQVAHPLPGTTEPASAESEVPAPPLPAPPCADSGYAQPVASASPFPDEKEKRRADALAGLGRCRWASRKWADHPVPFGVIPQDIALAQGNFVAAIEIYTTESLPTLWLNPTGPPAAVPSRYLSDQAQSLFNVDNGNFFSAAERAHAKSLIELALRARPSLVGALSLKGDILRLENDVDGAIENYTRAIAADPTDANGSYKLAFALNQKTNSTLREQQLAADSAKNAAKIAGYTYPMLAQSRTAEYINMNLREAATRQAQIIGLINPRERLRELRVLRRFSEEAHVAMPPLLAEEEFRRTNEHPFLNSVPGNHNELAQFLRYVAEPASPFYAYFGIFIRQQRQPQTPLNGPELYLSRELQER